jgi:hypothetical protein
MAETYEKQTSKYERTTSLYAPELSLAEQLDEFMQTARVTNYTESNVCLNADETLCKRRYLVCYDGFELRATETLTPIATFVSFEGNLGLASAAILAQAVRRGSMTLVYTDEILPDEPTTDCYQDLTAEWYPDSAVNNNLPDLRFAVRPDQFEAEELQLSTVEAWADHWLSLA